MKFKNIWMQSFFLKICVYFYEICFKNLYEITWDCVLCMFSLQRPTTGGFGSGQIRSDPGDGNSVLSSHLDSRTPSAYITRELALGENSGIKSRHRYVSDPSILDKCPHNIIPCTYSMKILKLFHVQEFWNDFFTPKLSFKSIFPLTFCGALM